MSRLSKGPRLRLRAGRKHSRTGKALAPVYYIRDGQIEVSTGFGPDRAGEAQKALADYIIAQQVRAADQAAAPSRGDPASVYIAEVIALYAEEKAPKAPDPSAVRARLNALLGWWIDKTVADVRRSTCEAYVAFRQTQPKASYKDPATAPRVTVQGARRELEDLSAAIGYWDAEHHLTRRPKVILPEKPESNRDALTRSQAARILKAARGYRLDGEGRWKRLQASSVSNRRHVARFVLTAIYTGTRPGVIPKLLWNESPVQAWVDLDDGVVYRRGKEEREHRTKRRPMVRLPRRLHAHMRRWKAADDRRQERMRKAQQIAGLPPTFTITSVIHHGGHPLAGRIRRSFESCVADAGIAEEITPHWMRHTCATWLMEREVPVWDAAAYTGMTVATLEKCYGHHRPSHQQKARDALGGRR